MTNRPTETTSESSWIEPYEGFIYRPTTIVVSSLEQSRALNVCAINPAIYNNKVDPSHFIGLAIMAGVENGISADGSINMVQNLIQHQPATLDAPIQVEGRVVHIEEVPRGRVVSSEVRFSNDKGELLVTASRRSLRPDPSKTASRGAGARPPAVMEDVKRLDFLREQQLTPDIVRNYKSEGNPIHYDQKAAEKSGFRAPLIGGGMGVHYLMAEIWKAFSPSLLDLNIYFRRPIFWDDKFRVLAQKEPDTWLAICLAKEEKIATEARINHISS